MHEIIFRIVISGILAIAIVLFMAKIRRSTGSVFYESPVSVFGWASVVFSLGVWFFLGWVDIYTDPGPVEQGAIGIMVFLSIVWLIPLFALIGTLSKRYEIKNKTLTKKYFFSKPEYIIDISKITSIEIIYSYESQHFQANMCDGVSHHIDDAVEDLDRLFYRLGQINNNIHFHFPIHHTGEGSFFDRLFNLGTIIAAVVYAVGFYILLGRIL